MGSPMKIKSLELSKEQYYYCCAAGLGDTLLVCGFLEKLKEKLNSDICLLIKESHKILMDMYGISNYIIVDCNDVDLNKLSDQNPTPQKGKIYLAHPAFHKELWSFFEPIYYQTSTIFFADWFKEFLGIEKEIELQLPIQAPEIKSKFKEKIEKLAPLDKIVLFVPDATSMRIIPKIYWENLANELINEGYFIITNSINPQDCVPRTHYLEMSVEELVTLALSCAKVYSLRNGLCDLIYSKGKDLYVFYSSHNAYYIFSLNKMFKRTDINEKVVLNLNLRNKSFKLLGKYPFIDIEKLGFDTNIKLFGKTIFNKHDGF